MERIKKVEIKRYKIYNLKICDSYKKWCEKNEDMLRLDNSDSGVEEGWKEVKIIMSKLYLYNI